MRRLSLIISLLVLQLSISAQDPHGDELNMDCALCHDPSGWSVDINNIRFDHNTTNFKLEGTHTQTDCKLCHSTLVFDEAPMDCISCHTDVHSMSVGNDCKRCHDSNTWLVDFIPELHEQNGFPLIGAHAVLSCEDCHISETNLRFDRIGNDCINCHLEDYQRTQEPNHQEAGFSTNCIECHDPNGFGWYTENVDHNFFPLTQGHDIQNCNECHLTNVYSDASPECISCHQADYTYTSNPNHEAINIGNDCISCHTTEPEWIPASFDMHNEYYTLNGAHAIMSNECAECHNGDYNNTPNTCIGCHQEEYNDADDPNHVISQFSSECLECHTEDSWDPSIFDHDGQYFPIYSGDHDGEWSDCIDCHINPVDYTIYTCVSCHENIETLEDHEGVSGYIYESEACLACHPTGTGEGGFDHATTNFLLTEGHFGVDCIDCHADGYEGTSTDCNDCHNIDYTNTINPNHSEINISTDCISCHSTELGWMPATFPEHNDFYPLNGAHAIIENNCVECHDGEYINTPNTCIACHQDEYDASTDPNHSVAQFSSDCLECHNEDDWTPAVFELHDGLYFPIYSGEHDGEWSDCVDCHTNPSNYEEFTCITCHINSEMQTEHEGISGYVYESGACLACHPTGTAIGGFDHNSTNFILTGGHFGVDCIECHADGYVGTSMVCNDCHTVDFTNTTNPNHNAIGISTDCISCHTTDLGWMPASFENHDDYYTLNGAHVIIANDCIDCHNGDYNNTPNTCAGCHQTEYNTTTDPNHSTSQFPTDCILCHSEDDWTPATLDHNLTDFPLTGSHTTTDCIECHSSGYTGTSSTCNDCHNVEYTSTTNPNHNMIGISIDCINCHTTEPGWIPASFDNHNDYYALNGAHAIIANDCIDCHNGDYVNTPNTCAGCHQSDFDNTTDPNHSAALFPNDCITCHTENEWDPSTFDHDGQYFAIYTGTHNGEWDNCATCHTTSNNFALYTCFSCHDESVLNQIDSHEASAAYFLGDCVECHQ